MAAPGFSLMRDSEQSLLRRIALGLALSLAAHVLLMAIWHAPRSVMALPAPRPLAVHLRPPPPAPVETALLPTAPAPASRTAPRTKPKLPRSVIAVAPKAAEPAADPFVVDQPPAEATPHFDPDAARKMARSLANMKDPAKEGTAVGQFPDKPLETETRAARAIGAAKRTNCKDGLPGGLLGPLLILADKKDSGCKW